MKNEDIIENIKSKFTNSATQSINVEKVTELTLRNLLVTCDSTKHMEERIEWYDDEEDGNKNTWIDVEGEGYGWVWVNHPEEKWHGLLKRSLLEYIKRKQLRIGKKDEYVIVANKDNKIIYHFIEREILMCDTIYTFSNDELYF